MTGSLATPLSNSRILVTGGAGFVGSNLVKLILETASGVDITVVDNLLSSEKENLPDSAGLSFVEGSITDDRILSGLRDEFDYVFHLSTYHGNQSSIHNPLADHENNTLTTLKLYERLKNFRRIKKVVYSSAGCSVAAKTFGDAAATTEDDPIGVSQDSPYSISKIIGEFYSAYYTKQHGLPVVRARFQNVYGPGEVLGAGRWRGTPATVWRNVTPVFIYKALHAQPLPVENKGIATRDFIYVSDICIGLILCALKGTPGDVYNLATGGEVSIASLAGIVNEMTGNPAGIENKPGRPWDHSGKRFGSAEKSKKALGFEASTGLREGLSATIGWTRENMDFIERCIGKHQGQLEEAASGLTAAAHQ